MPQIQPFKGILYNSKKINPGHVMAPPYDVISPRMQDELYRLDKHNIVRLILGKEEPKDSAKDNKHLRAKQFFNNWLKENILLQDRKPAIYIYSQEYIYENKVRTRWGFIAKMKIEDPKTSKVLPHEYTFAKPKEDRLNLIREVKANLSPIFSLFQDEGAKAAKLLKNLAKGNPILDVEREGVRNRLWRIDNKAAIKKIQEILCNKEIYIADGHHRYEVALMYRDEISRKQKLRTPNSELQTKPYNYVMMYFSPLNQQGITILSTHRMVKGINIDVAGLLRNLKSYFDIKIYKAETQLFKKMTSVKDGEYAFGMYTKSKVFYLLKLKKGISVEDTVKEGRTKEWKRLDVSVLHGIILDDILGLREKVHNEECIIYTRDPEYAVAEVDKGNCELAFFLNPTKVRQVRDIARKGDRMPHKSTYFYPKLLSGLVINKLY